MKKKLNSVVAMLSLVALSAQGGDFWRQWSSRWPRQPAYDQIYLENLDYDDVSIDDFVEDLNERLKSTKRPKSIPTVTVDRSLTTFILESENQAINKFAEQRFPEIISTFKNINRRPTVSLHIMKISLSDLLTYVNECAFSGWQIFVKHDEIAFRPSPPIFEVKAYKIKKSVLDHLKNQGVDLTNPKPLFLDSDEHNTCYWVEDAMAFVKIDTPEGFSSMDRIAEMGTTFCRMK